MVRASEPSKGTFALSAMNRLQRINPDAFARDMGTQAVGMVNEYRDNLSYKSGPEIVEELRAQTILPRCKPVNACVRKGGRKPATFQMLPGSITLIRACW